MSQYEPRMTIVEVEQLMDTVFVGWRKVAIIESLDAEGVTVRMPLRPLHIRPGGTVSGPALMALADIAAYLLILALAGPVVSAVTSNLNISFLARPAAADVVATVRMLRLGKRNAVATVEMRSDGSTDVVAHATVSYALPAPSAGTSPS